MEALRLTFTLAGAMEAPEHPIHLDGILHALAAKNMGLHEGVAENQDRVRFVLDGLLAYEGAAGAGVYKASVLRAHPPYLHSIRCITRRNDASEVAEDQLSGFLVRRGDQINRNFGRERNALWRQPMIWPRLISAHCIGDREGIEDLVRQLTHIGGGRNVGSGAVREVTVAPSDDAEAWRLRVFDAPLGGGIEFNGRYRPPYYWRHQRGAVWAAPGALTAL